MSDQEFIAAIQRGDIPFLEEYLARHPHQISRKLPSWSVPGVTDFSYGFALHCAASFNQPALVELFVKKYKADINHTADSTVWTPLRYATASKAYEASVRLVELGADVNRSGTETIQFHQTEKMKEILDPDYKEKKRRAAEEARQQKIAGTWTRTTEKEVVHDHEQPEQNYRLTDIFNFETRVWRSVTKDLTDKGISSNLVLFDDMMDKTILRQALDKLRELGGEADDSILDRPSIRDKKPAPQKNGA